jgi:hypothetical protein
MTCRGFLKHSPSGFLKQSQWIPKTIHPSGFLKPDKKKRRKSLLQIVAKMLQIAVAEILQIVATKCNKMQQNATKCNKMQQKCKISATNMQQGLQQNATGTATKCNKMQQNATGTATGTATKCNRDCNRDCNRKLAVPRHFLWKISIWTIALQHTPEHTIESDESCRVRFVSVTIS